MSSLYKRTDSRYWWITFRDSEDRICQESTRLSWANPLETRKARALEAQKTAEELERGANPLVGRRKRKGWAWVQPWLDVRYHSSATTLERYTDCWRTIQMFLTDEEIEGPINLTRDHCFSYVRWRRKAEIKKGKYRACHNTALLELKILGLVMQEATLRGFAQGNPCVKLGIKKDAAKVKPALTQEDANAIRAGIKTITDPAVRRMLALSFEISRFQGCRLTETALDPNKDVDLEAMEITFRIKGKKHHVTALHPALVPLFKQLRAEGRKLTWETPPGRGRQWASAKWWKFLDRIGLKARGVTHHGNRVASITDMGRNNVSKAKALRFIGHSSEDVQRVYERLVPDDLESCVRAIASGDKPELL